MSLNISKRGEEISEFKYEWPGYARVARIFRCKQKVSCA